MTESRAAVRDLPVESLQRGAYQPRSSFGEASLASLIETVREDGIIQPLLVRPVGTGSQFEIIAGERRWRAAQALGLTHVPAIVRRLSDRDALALALIENIQRADLNPMEEARGLKRLSNEFDLTHAEISTRVGRSRAAVSNLIRLLELQPDVQSLLESGELSMGHARALLPLPAKAQIRLGALAAEKSLTVRQVERQVNDQLDRDPQGIEDTPEFARQVMSIKAESKWLGKMFSDELGRPVGVGIRKTGGRTLGLTFDSLDELHDHLKKLEDVVGRLRAAAGPRSTK